MLSLNLIKRLFQCKTIIERPDLISKNETLSVPFLASQELMVEWSPLMVHNVLMEIIKESSDATIVCHSDQGATPQPGIWIVSEQQQQQQLDMTLKEIESATFGKNDFSYSDDIFAFYFI